MVKIMICDDSNSVRNLLERKLTSAGYSVVAKAHDGEEGIRVYAETKPDLVLLDVTMPNKDGRSCLAGILEINPSAMVVMVSALQDRSIIEKCLSEGAKAFIQKEKLYKDEDFNEHVIKLINEIFQKA